MHPFYLRVPCASLRPTFLYPFWYTWYLVFDVGMTGDWSTVVLDPGVWYSTVREGACRFMAAWVKEEEKTSKHRQRKREAEEAD